MSGKEYSDEQTIKLARWLLDKELKEKKSMLDLMEITNEMIEQMAKANEGVVPEGIPSPPEGSVNRLRLAVKAIEILKEHNMLDTKDKAWQFLTTALSMSKDAISDAFINMQVDSIEA